MTAASVRTTLNVIKYLTPFRILLPRPFNILKLLGRVVQTL
jgi:hypothetical protein